MVHSGYDDAADADVDDDQNDDDDQDKDDVDDDQDDDDLPDNLLFQVTAVRQTSNTPQFHALSGNKQSSNS